MVSIELSELGTELEIKMPFKAVKGTVVEKPFYDPKKKLTNNGL